MISNMEISQFFCFLRLGISWFMRRVDHLLAFRHDNGCGFCASLKSLLGPKHSQNIFSIFPCKTSSTFNVLQVYYKISCKDCLVIFTISAMWYYCEVLSEVLHHSNLCNDFTPQTQGGFPAVAYNSGMVFTCISLLHLWILLGYSIPCCSVLLHLGLPKPCYCLLNMARYFWFSPPLFYILSALCHLYQYFTSYCLPETFYLYFTPHLTCDVGVGLVVSAVN